MDRRSVIKAVASVGIGVGTLFGTGAFRNVQAERTVSVSAADDSSALLNISANGSDVVTTESVGSQTVVKLNLSNLNNNSITEFGEAISVENTGSDQVDLWVADSSNTPGSDSWVGTTVDIEEGGTATSIVGSSQSGASTVTLDAAGGSTVSTTLDIKIDLINNTVPSSDGSIVLVAGQL